VSPDDVEKSMPQMVLSPHLQCSQWWRKQGAGYFENSQAFNPIPDPAEFAGSNAATCSYLEKIVLVVELI